MPPDKDRPSLADPEAAVQRSPGSACAWGRSADTLDPVRALCEDAKAAGKAVAFVRRGVPYLYLWNLGDPDPDRPRADVS